MSVREELRILTQAFIAAVIIEVLLLLGTVCSRGCNAQGIWIPSPIQMVYLYTHLIGMTIADKLGFGEIVCCAVTGIIQFFLIFYIGLVMWDWRKRRHPM
jgi:hypothetical protein